MGPYLNQVERRGCGGFPNWPAGSSLLRPWGIYNACFQPQGGGAEQEECKCLRLPTQSQNLNAVQRFSI